MNIKVQDAASLILVDDITSKEPKLAMGRRAAHLTFMPSIYVFPGGRVDPQDTDTTGGKLHKSTYQALQNHGGVTSGQHADSLAVAALRETHEEVDLYIDPESDCMNKLTFLTRATTPIGPPRRYDTRFFVLDASTAHIKGTIRPSEELDTVGWYSFAHIETLKTALITRMILSDFKNAFLSNQNLNNWVPPHHQNLSISQS